MHAGSFKTMLHTQYLLPKYMGSCEPGEVNTMSNKPHGNEDFPEIYPHGKGQ